jgi:hypothetical protein
MDLKRNARIAIATVVSSVALGTPAMAAGPVGTISAGPVTPTVAMSHKQWKKCWSTVYANYRGDGYSPANSTTAADWTCGDPPV